MITHAPLTPEQQEKSQYYHNLFSLVNGAAYVCLGENVVILLAICMGQNNYVISALGSMVFLGYLLLPLGKIMSAHSGGVGCQANFWVIRNTAALFIVGAVPLYLYGYHTLTTVVILLGMFIFYGARAAGVAVVQPLVGEITSPHTRAKFLAFNASMFYLSAFIGLSVIIFVLYFLGNNNIWVLAGIVLFGSCVGVLSTGFLRKMYESGKICENSRKPTLPEIKLLVKDNVYRRYIGAGMFINLQAILFSPISLLAVKRGYGISNTAALVYSVLLFASSTIASNLTTHPMRAIGPRRFAAIFYGIMLILGPLWLLAPEHFNYLYTAVIFIILGVSIIAGANAMNMYFLQTIEESKRVVASIMNAVFTGVGSGVLGILISSFLFRFLERFIHEGDSPLKLFRLYFLFVSIILIIGLFIILRMKPLPIEKRHSWKPVKWLHLK